MRNFTHYELFILIKNEVSLIKDCILSSHADLGYFEERCNDILNYIAEYKALPAEPF